MRVPGASPIGLSAYWSYCDESPASLAQEGGHVVVAKPGARTQSHDQGLNASFYAEVVHGSTLRAQMHRWEAR